MKIKTSELIRDALDWAVHYAIHGQCEGHSPYEYSSDWAHAGPIIEREGIETTPWYRERHLVEWSAKKIGSVYIGRGPTPLIAAMRCYVTSKLGDTVDVPEELI